ncbi:MAG: complex I NDUFA9 subunit family protein [Mariprofundaceae bacterium]|nr:complex I NDUFA9 subunit family protein [Mariprofundaceae bacterium]
MAKNICIIGGSGFVGRSVMRQALMAGYQVRVACRHPEKARYLLVAGVSDLCKADICSGKGLKEAVAGMDGVINLVGLLFERGCYTFDAAHVHGTRNILKACEALGVQRYLHMSALGASGQSESAYGRSKHAAEKLVRDSPLDWTIMRPSVIFGQEDDFFNKLDVMSRFLPVFPVIAGNTRFQPVWVEDVARAFVQSMGSMTSVGQSYDLGGPTSYTFHTLVDVLLAHKQRTRLCLPVPNAIAGMLAKVLQFLPVPPLTPDQLTMLQSDNVVDGDTPFPVCFGSPSSVESVLPRYINGVQAKRLQQQLNINRKSYRKL